MHAACLCLLELFDGQYYMPKVSIIMPVYNEELMVSTAISSVLRQSFTDWELLVFNDASTDNTLNVIKKFADSDPRVIIFSQAKNLGIIENLNAGLSVARGEYIARLDADDEWVDITKLSKQVKFLEDNTGFGLVGTWATMIDSSDNFLKKMTYPITDSSIRRWLLLRNCFVHSSILARKSAMIKAGGYDPNWRHIEDYALWLRIGGLCKIANLPCYSVWYRNNPHGITRTKNMDQLRSIRRLIFGYSKSYPNYLGGYIKWGLQFLYSSIFSR